MVAQIDEQQIAMVALAMHPARQANLGPDVLGPELAAIVGAIGVHHGDGSTFTWDLRAQRFARAPGACQAL